MISLLKVNLFYYYISNTTGTGLLMRFDFSQPDAFLDISLNRSISESIFYFQPEIFLCMILLPSFLFVISAYFSSNSSFKKFSATDKFIAFLMFVSLIAGFNFFAKALFLESITMFCFFFNYKFVISASVLYVKGILAFATVFALQFIKISNLEFRSYVRPLPEYFLFNPELFLVVMINLIFSCFLVSTTDIFALALFLQGLTITNYFLFVGSSAKSSIANALKYYFFSSWALVLLLLAIFLIYGVCGSLNFFVVANSISDLFTMGNTNSLTTNFSLAAAFYFKQFLIVIASFLFFFVLFFKLGLAPLHPVTIDVCETMPKPFLYVTMVINKFAIFVVLIKFSLIIFVDLFFYLQALFFLTGWLSIFYGTIHLLYTNKIKLFFGYIMLQSTGFLTIMLSFCIRNGNDFVTSIDLLTGIFQYFIISFLSWGIFFFVWIFSNGVVSYTWRVRKNITYVSDFSIIGIFLKFYNPFYRIAISFALLNIIGFPPLLIFFIKFFLLLSVAFSHSVIFAILLLLAFVLLNAKIFEIFRFLWLFYYNNNVKVFAEAMCTIKDDIDLQEQNSPVFFLVFGILFLTFCVPTQFTEFVENFLIDFLSC